MGATVTVSAAEAAATNANRAIGSFNVSDNATNVVAALPALAAASHLSSIAITGPVPLEVTARQFASYATVLHKLAGGTRLTVNAATAAQAATLQADASVTAFTVMDSAAGIAASLGALAKDTKLTSIQLLGAAPLNLTAATYALYQSTIGKLVNGQSANISGVTVAQAATLQADSHVGGFTVADTGASLLAGLAGLAKDGKLTGLTLTGSSTLAVTWDQFNGYQSTLDKLGGAVLTLSGLTAGQALVAWADKHVASVTVADTAMHLHDALYFLVQDSQVGSISVSDAARLTLAGSAEFATYQGVLAKLVAGQSYAATGLTVAQAAKAQADVHCASFTVADTAANVHAALKALAADTHLATLRTTDGPLALTASEYAGYSPLVAKLETGSAATVAGATAAAATVIGGDAHVWKIGVADTLANIGANLDALEALAKAGRLSGIAVTDSGKTLTLGAAQYAADADAIKLLSGAFTIAQTAPGGFHLKLVYDASVAAAPTAFKAALDLAVKYFESTIASPETVTLQVGYGECGGQSLGAGVLGEAGPSRGVYVGYDQFKAAFAAHATSATQQTVLANLGADPTNGGKVFVASAEAKALGLMSAGDTGVDGVLGFARDATGGLFDYDRSDGVAAGRYDFLGVVEHEITHALGRFAYLDNAHKVYSVQDLTRYSGNGVHQLNASGFGYFSIDGGRTNLDTYATTSDPGDWAASAGHDANNAYASPGVVNLFTQTDLVQMAALGYALV